MPINTLVSRLTRQEDINFLLTNRLPRRLVTRFMGWFSKVEVAWIKNLSLATWKLFAPDLDLSDAKKTSFKSLHDCFIRELKPGARNINHLPEIIISPCDAIVGEMGKVDDTRLYQAKGFPYRLEDLLHSAELVNRYRNGLFVTLRLTSTMYHRFHAPCDCSLQTVNYISGDTWNVNPVALKRVEQLFCKNERVVLDLDTGDQEHAIALVPIAAILVASIKLHCLAEPLDLTYSGANHIQCSAQYRNGEEMGYFQHGSTIVVFARGGFEFVKDIETGLRIKMGQGLFMKT